jgi:hypothetical protein
MGVGDGHDLVPMTPKRPLQGATDRWLIIDDENPRSHEAAWVIVVR